MIQTTQDIQFTLSLRQYKRINTLGWLFVTALALLVGSTIILGILLWRTYTHSFTPYLKWQDALLSLSWFIALIALGGIILAGRFLYASSKGYTQSMITLTGNSIRVRDLSPANLRSIFQVMNSAFCCFIIAFIGLSPSILIGWTLQLSPIPLLLIATAIASLLALAGLIISILVISLIIIGSISFCRKLGSWHTYELDSHTSLSIDNLVLTIIQADRTESMIDLHLLSVEDQSRLLTLLRQRWTDAEQKWSPTFGTEVAQTSHG